jgi:acyl-[acyl-carrier-protein]-phospholipid O-acyltransferase/long-chain-fatty-acid--[acyl-carrier-protein] ligase
MSSPDLSLLSKRRFGPLFVVQFLGAFNDNMLKFGMFVLASFTLYKDDPTHGTQLEMLATALFILPYLLLSALAGQLADAMDKAKLMRFIKAAEIAFMAIGLAGFWLQSIPLLLTALFLMGVHSTIFGPVKYAILPQHLGEHELMGGTGVIEAGTFLAILGGQVLAGLVKPWEAGMIATGLAVVGFLASLMIPAAPASAPGLKVELNVFKGSWHVLKVAQQGRDVWLAIIGISWFFAVAAVVVTEFAPLVQTVLDAQQDVATLLLLVFSVSIALGSVAVGKILKGEVSARTVPWAALGMAAFLIDLWIATRNYDVVVESAHIKDFVASPGAWHIMLALAGLAFSGGLFIVPLYAILQTHSAPETRSQTIAANNIMNAVCSVVLIAAMTALIGQAPRQRAQMAAPQAHPQSFAQHMIALRRD